LLIINPGLFVAFVRSQMWVWRGNLFLVHARHLPTLTTGPLESKQSCPGAVTSASKSSGGHWISHGLDQSTTISRGLAGISAVTTKAEDQVCTCSTCPSFFPPHTCRPWRREDIRATRTHCSWSHEVQLLRGPSDFGFAKVSAGSLAMVRGQKEQPLPCDFILSAVLAASPRIQEPSLNICAI
jgi:hypothetical protein